MYHRHVGIQQIFIKDNRKYQCSWFLITHFFLKFSSQCGVDLGEYG